MQVSYIQLRMLVIYSYAGQLYRATYVSQLAIYIQLCRLAIYSYVCQLYITVYVSYIQLYMLYITAVLIQVQPQLQTHASDLINSPGKRKEDYPVVYAYFNCSISFHFILFLFLFFVTSHLCQLSGPHRMEIAYLSSVRTPKFFALQLLSNCCTPDSIMNMTATYTKHIQRSKDLNTRVTLFTHTFILA